MICTAFVSQEGGYRCGCRDGFELQADGRSCAPALLCSQTCENNGRCFRGKCLCAPGFTGQRCEADIDECLASVSVHGCNYQCKNTFGDYECICAHGYSRLSDKKSCMRNFPDVSCDKPCQNGGVCRSNNRCECLRGYEGDDCSKDVDECSRYRPCDPDFATCHNTEGSFECRCRDGYILMLDGRHCLPEKRAAQAPHLVWRGNGQKGVIVASLVDSPKLFESERSTMRVRRRMRKLVKRVVAGGTEAELAKDGSKAKEGKHMLPKEAWSIRHQRRPKRRYRKQSNVLAMPLPMGDDG